MKSGIFLSVLAVVVAAILASVLYLTFASMSEQQVKAALFEQQRQRQIENTQETADHIGSDLERIVLHLEILSRSPQLQAGDLSDQQVRFLLKSMDDDINEFAVTSGIHVLDENNVIVNVGRGEDLQYIGADRSDADYVKPVREGMEAYVGNGAEAIDGKYHIPVAVPILDHADGEYRGMIRISLPSAAFFEHYGNVADYNSQYVIGLDRAGTYLSAPRTDFIGLNFFSKEAQERLDNNEGLNMLYSGAIRSGGLTFAIFDTLGLGERFGVAAPVNFRGEQVMTIVQAIPTAAIYQQIENTLFAQKVQTMIFIAAFATVVAAIVAAVLRWNRSLEIKVTERTQQLLASNEQLKRNDMMQREFINIAAHELRTPIQPLLGMADILNSQFDGCRSEVRVTKPEVEILVRNARRLERLSSDILEVSRIESGCIVLHKEDVDLDEQIMDVIDYSLGAIPPGKDVRLAYEPAEHQLVVDADRSRLFEVLSNLVKNAIKFTESGTVTVRARRKEGLIIVSVSDTGTGIDPEIFPRLFTKFATKSEQGTGLGLYISKSIIEAHGGRIWAENNKDGKGAMFTFTLPITREESVSV